MGPLSLDWSWAQACEAVWQMASDPGGRLWSCKWALAAVQASCAALLCLRAGRALPAWNRASKAVYGAGWARLAFQKRSPGSGAHPEGLALYFCGCLMLGAGALAGAFDGRLASEAARLADQSYAGAGAALFIEVFYTLAFSVFPVHLLSKALKDEQTPVGQALQQESGFPLARDRSNKEALLLDQATPESSGPRKGAARRRL